MTGGYIRLPNPHPGQIQVRQQAKRFNWLAAGRRWRKTTMSMSIAVEEAVKGKRILWGAPTFDQVRIGWQETRHGVGAAARFTVQRMMAEFPSGGAIIYRSLDNPDNARGHTADGVVIDEVGDVKDAAWYEVLRPMLIDTDGWLWAIGTPKGRNWFWREHVNAHDREDSQTWQVPTLGVAVQGRQLVRRPHPLENPNIAFSEIEQLWHTTPQRIFEQEILAEFTEEGGGVFRRIMEAATSEGREEAEPDHAYVFGVDWGKHHDFTVVSVLDATEKRQVKLDRYNKIDYHTQVGRLEALYKRFHPRQIIAERNSMGEPLIEQLGRMNMRVTPFTTTNASKQEAVDALSLAFERGELAILPDATQINELQAFEARRLPSGMLRYEAPEGMHDDTVIALALAWQAIARRRLFVA